MACIGNVLFVVGLHCYESVLGVGVPVWRMDCLLLVCIVMNLSWVWDGQYGERIVCCWFVLL